MSSSKNLLRSAPAFCLSRLDLFRVLRFPDNLKKHCNTLILVLTCRRASMEMLTKWNNSKSEVLICRRASTLEMLTNSVPDNLGHSQCIFESRPKNTFSADPTFFSIWRQFHAFRRQTLCFCRNVKCWNFFFNLCLPTEMLWTVKSKSKSSL